MYQPAGIISDIQIVGRRVYTSEGGGLRIGTLLERQMFLLVARRT